jgi:hypothetical protein
MLENVTDGLTPNTMFYTNVPVCVKLPKLGGEKKSEKKKKVFCIMIQLSV